MWLAGLFFVLKLAVPTTIAAAEAMMDPGAAAWNGIAVTRVALNRTPPVYDTDPPAELEIPMLEVRLARAPGKLLVHLTWKDRTQDTVELAKIPATAPETRVMKEHTAESARFFDAAAVMSPSHPSAGDETPSLQMGDAKNPVNLYYWNATRGAMLMEGQGRGTTKRTGSAFPARSAYSAGTWRVTLELPEAAARGPLAFAVFNGSQMDRDGRKYFSVWHRPE
jgi:hypothetical protein